MKFNNLSNRFWSIRLKLTTPMILMGGLYLLVMGMTMYWIRQDTLPLPYDYAGYMAVSGSLGQPLSHGNLVQAAKIFIHHDIWGQRPALFPLTGALAFLLVGSSVHRILFLTNLFWASILLFSTYQIATFFGKRNNALIAGFIILTTPVIFGSLRNYTIDMPLTAAVATAMACLFTTDGFRNRGKSIFFACIFGMGMLTKETFLLYMVIPVLVYFVSILLDQSTGRKARLVNYITSVFIALLFALPVYIPIVGPLLKNVLENVGNKVGQFYSRGYTRSQLGYYTVYLKLLIGYGMPFLYLIIPLLGYSINIFMPKSPKRQNKIIENTFNNLDGLAFLSWMIVPPLILTLFVVDTNYRFIMPILPAIAVALSILIGKINSNFIYKVTITLLLLIGIIQFYAMSFGVKTLPSEVSFRGYSLWNQFNIQDPFIKLGKPLKENWPVQPVLTLIRNEADTSASPVWVGLLTNTTFFSENIFSCYANLGNLPLRFIGIGEWSQNTDYINNINNVIYIVTKSGDTGPPFATVYYKEANQYLQQLVKKKVYQLIGKFPLPDGTNAMVYKRLI